jgi:hypothetical protein
MIASAGSCSRIGCTHAVEVEPRSRFPRVDHSSHSAWASAPASNGMIDPSSHSAAHSANSSGSAADRQIGAIDAVQFLRVGVDVDQLLAGVIGRDHGVAIGRRLAQPRTHQR